MNVDSILVDNVVGVNCVCGKVHKPSKSATELLLQAFMNGDAQIVNRYGVTPICLQTLYDKIVHYRRKERVSFE